MAVYPAGGGGIQGRLTRNENNGDRRTFQNVPVHKGALMRRL
jgi:hypothetical protein